MGGPGLDRRIGHDHGERGGRKGRADLVAGRVERSPSDGDRVGPTGPATVTRTPPSAGEPVVSR
jgi:hypothetical protein